MTSTELEGQYLIAYNFYQHGKYKEAIDSFEKLSLHDMKSSKNWMGLAASYQMTQQYEDALKAYAIAGFLTPTNPYVHFHAAECFFALNDKEEGLLALEEAEKTLQNKETDRELLSRIALLRKGS